MNLSKIKLKLTLLCLSLSAGHWALAQVSNTSQLSGQNIKLNTITTSVPFLSIGPDSRAGGLGDCGVSTSPDANSMHWNPSKYAFIDKASGLSTSYTPWLRRLVNDINLAYLSFYFKPDKNQALAASLRYFSLGDITFTDVVGNTIGQFRPNEFALDVAYSRKLADHFAGGLALRYIYSNLTNNITVNGAGTRAGQAVSADLSGYYKSDEFKMGSKKGVYRAGLNLSNLGSKISYSETAVRDFIPMMLRLGNTLDTKLDDYNTLSITGEISKLLVPTPPEYKRDANGSPEIGPDGNKVIAAGKNPNVGTLQGITQSFYDAPGGYKEELREVMWTVAVEYMYNNLFAFRTGYFHEAASKGNRQYFTVGAGIRYNVFGLDFAYLIPTVQQNPLQNTLRFTLLFSFEAFKSQNKGDSEPAKE